ncbi:MAG: hypothetical protein F4X58_02300 [Chloroflexi bacterium]|nr:hypothetical protein [Chloroflexota bacterium]MYC00736.1 hypothetical protein [Chloroflexota bacterium]
MSRSEILNISNCYDSCFALFSERRGAPPANTRFANSSGVAPGILKSLSSWTIQSGFLLLFGFFFVTRTSLH